MRTVREAVGQLLEYRYFRDLSAAKLYILLDQRPEEPVVDYVEGVLRTYLCWWDGNRLCGGPMSAKELGDLGISG